MRTSRRWMMPAGLLAASALVMPLQAQTQNRSGAAFDVNRVGCGMWTTGEICLNFPTSSSLIGAAWPKRTANMYSFNSGLQLAGIVDPGGPSNPWAGDTAGGFFFDAKGTTQHGLGISGAHDASLEDDLVSWPEAARVPSAGAGAGLFTPALRGRASASQGDLWWLSWEGDPRQAAGRPHPLGVVAEHRVMGWNYPEGNEDVMYVLYTFTNITSLDEADYGGIEPVMRALLTQQARAFHDLAADELGVDLPDGGYTITNFFAGIGADFDVGDAGRNYSGVHLPFAMGNTYDARFAQVSGWTFDHGIHAEPFEPGAGFIGVKFLGGSEGRGQIRLFANQINSGAFRSPRTVSQLWRYLAGQMSPLLGDDPCTHDPLSGVCYVNVSDPADMRFGQSAPLGDLAPGQQVTLAVAYVFAAPVAVASHVPGSSVTPGDPLRFSDPSQLASVGANLVDSIAGFLDYNDVNGDGIAQQDEYVVQPRSFLDKALVAQRLFDNKFVLPVAPEAPEFHLIPGSNQVTIVWRPSPSEETGDPYFELASTATVVPPHGGPPVPNVLYDPNFRQFDVEGYRIYRGRTSDPQSMTLLASFDYAGTTMRDYSGTASGAFSFGAQPLTDCAPELFLFDGCGVDYVPEEFAPGVTRSVWRDIPLSGTVVQVRGGDRFLTSRGDGALARADTASLPGAEEPLALEDNGVPFLYVDKAVRNSFRYFYSVVAFDVNSYASGPSSMESVRIVKEVTPRPPATDREYEITFTQAVYGRGVELTDTVVPTIDPVRGTFSKPFPPSDGWQVAVPFIAAELMSGEQQIVVRLDSISPLGNAIDNTPSTVWITVNPGTPRAAQLSYSLDVDPFSLLTTARQMLPGAVVDAATAAPYGVAQDHEFPAFLEVEHLGASYTTSQARGCISGLLGIVARACSYQGARWFDGPSPGRNETAANPTAGNYEIDFFGDIAFPLSDWNNAGRLTGVTTIQEPRAYLTVQSLWRGVEGMLAHVARAADFNVYWGEGGRVDSVVDVTHNVPVPFRDDINASWGILNPSAGAAGGSIDGAPGVLTIADWGCIAPMNQSPSIGVSPTGVLDCTAALPYQLSNTAFPGPSGMVSGVLSNSDEAAASPRPNPGFGFYLAGHIFMMEMPALPAEGTVWTMRSYTGSIEGGQGGIAGDEGPYRFVPAQFGAKRPFTAVGAEIRLTINATNARHPSTLADLDRVHTVPDPYYVSSAFEQTVDENALRFVNLPSAAVIRIYSSSGVLVDVIEHNSATSGGSASWDVRSREGELVASGVYFYHIESGDARRVGRFTVVRAS